MRPGSAPHVAPARARAESVTAARGLPPSACRACTGPTSAGYSLCKSCRDVAVALGRPPVPVTPLAIVTAESPLYLALRQYKSAPHDVARRQSARLAAILGMFFRRHGRCVMPEGADAIVVVPSGAAGRPPPHPLVAVAAAAAAGVGADPGGSAGAGAGAGMSFGPVVPWLTARREPRAAVGHRHASAQAFVASSGVAGQRILLLDDVYTTGAHLQSAAAALLGGGAAVVRGLVIARFARWPLPGGAAELRLELCAGHAGAGHAAAGHAGVRDSGPSLACAGDTPPGGVALGTH